MTDQYKVLSKSCTLGEIGITVTSADVEGYNVAALIAGGHLEVVTQKTTKTESDTKGS
jgi:hypothetical protein